MSGGWGPLVLQPKIPLEVVTVGSTQVPGDTAVVDPTFSKYGEISSVPQLTLSTIVSLVIPATPIIHVLYIEYGGCNVSEYYLDIDGTREARHSTYFGGDLDGIWDFRNPGGGGKLLPASKTLKVETEHCRPDDGSFWARICYMEIN